MMRTMVIGMLLSWLSSIICDELGHIPPAAVNPIRQLKPPVIDVSCLCIITKEVCENISSCGDYDEAKASIIKSIDEAASRWGFFYLIGHGLNPSMIESLKTQMKSFFNSTSKYTIRRTITNSRGFADDELTKQLVDKKEIFDMGHVPNRQLPSDHPENVVMDGYNQYPPDNHEFRDAIDNYYEKVSMLANELITIISDDILKDIPAAVNIKTAFVNHTSLFRLNYYPINPLNALEPSIEGDGITSRRLGISRHTDAGVLTLLLQEDKGLEVYSGSKQDNNDGEWVPVDPVTGAITVNIGDMLQVWSNGRFKAAEHRVQASVDTPRYTAAFFYNPSYETIIQPYLLGNETPKYRPIEWGYFRRQRFLGDYADFGKEIQIEDYLISIRG